MKKYLKPEIEVIVFTPAKMCTGSPTSLNVDLSDENAGDNQFTQKENMWDSDTWMR